MKDSITVSFGISEMMRIKQILIDEDKDEALKFIKEYFSNAIRDAEFGICEPLIQKEKVDKIIENIRKGGK